MNIILLTTVSGAVFQRAMSAYQLAHNCREHGYTCQVIDFINDFTETELVEILKRCIDDKTLCIGVSTSFFNDFKLMVGNKSELPLVVPAHIEASCRTIKNTYPNVRIVLGGAKAIEGLNFDWVDDVFLGYSEDQFLDYCNDIKSAKQLKQKNVFDRQNYNFDISTLNHRFLKEDCILENEVLPIEISRGCIFKCKFCAFPLNGKKKLDYIRDFNEIRDELIYNYENFGTTKYFFNDDTLNDSVFKVEGLHKIITSLPFKIEFSSWMRLDLLYKHPHTIQLLKEMGTGSTFFGIESFNSKTLKTIGKTMNPNKVKDFLLDLYYNKWNEEIPLFLGMIAGLPYDTEDSIMDHANWLSSTPFTFHFEPLRIADSGGSFYKSEFELNYKDYGYDLDENGRWSNSVMNQDIAENIATEINNRNAFSNNTVAGTFLFALLNHFDYDYLKGRPASDISNKKLIVTRRKLIKRYKDLLFAALPINTHKDVE